MLDFIRNLDGSAVEDDNSKLNAPSDVVKDSTAVVNEQNDTAREGFQYNPSGLPVAGDDGSDADASIAKMIYGDIWHIGFQGGLIAPVAGTVHFGARDHSPSIGRWMESDQAPAAYVEGCDFYLFEADNTLNEVEFEKVILQRRRKQVINTRMGSGDDHS